ncbi:hypothetical protein ACWEP4_43935 [Streptomyces sp. NPDC004227]
MNTETDWVYRVFEPHGSEGWRPYGSDPEWWQGVITAPDSTEGAKYAIGRIVGDLMTEWEGVGLRHAMHVRVFLWQTRRATWRRRTSSWRSGPGRTSRQRDLRRMRLLTEARCDGHREVVGVPGGGAARLRHPASPRRPLPSLEGKITTDTPRQGAEYAAN